MIDLNLSIGLSNVCALPFAVSYQQEEDWETSTVAFHVGPFLISLSWRWS